MSLAQRPMLQQLQHHSLFGLALGGLLHNGMSLRICGMQARQGRLRSLIKLQSLLEADALFGALG